MKCLGTEELAHVSSELAVVLEQKAVSRVFIELDQGMGNQSRQQVRIVGEDHRVTIAVGDEHRHLYGAHSLK